MIGAKKKKKKIDVFKINLNTKQTYENQTQQVNVNNPLCWGGLHTHPPTSYLCMTLH